MTSPDDRKTTDYGALSAPFTKQDVAAFRAANRASGANWAGSAASQTLGTASTVVVIAVVGFALVTMVFSTSGVSENPVALAFLAFVGALVLVGGIAAARALSAGRWKRWMRMSRFAEANGMLYWPRGAAPRTEEALTFGEGYPGAIFSSGSSRETLDRFVDVSPDPRFVDFASYRYVTGSGKSRTTHDWGYLAMRLDRRLPHMMLDAKSNNFLGSNLPSSFRRDQVLSLEGDFDKYFTLYCPREYERDALYVFTPDLMALLIDGVSDFDVEIVDDWLFCYSSSPFPAADEATYRRLLGIVETVGAKTLRQSARYSDDHVGDFAANTVAAPGRRLRSGAPLVAAIVGAVVLVTIVWSITGDLFG